MEDRLWEQPHTPCVLLTACGMPDVATRAFLKRLADADPHMPVLGLVDGNAYGLAILLCYAHGSASSRESLAWRVPRLRWIGLHQADLARFDVPAAAMQPTSVHDDAKATSLLRHPAVQAHAALAYEVQAWLLTRRKAEIESLQAGGRIGFLSATYLPAKVGGGAAGAGHPLFYSVAGEQGERGAQPGAGGAEEEDGEEDGEEWGEALDFD